MFTTTLSGSTSLLLGMANSGAFEIILSNLGLNQTLLSHRLRGAHYWSSVILLVNGVTNLDNPAFLASQSHMVRSPFVPLTRLIVGMSEELSTVAKMRYHSIL